MTETLSVAAPFPTVRVGPVPVSLADAAEVLDWVQRRVDGPDGTPCVVLNHLAAHPTVQARRDAHLARVLQRADCNVADGMGTVWAARVLSGTTRPRARVYGPDAMLAILERGRSLGWRHAFVGGTPEVLPRLLDRLTRRMPDLRVVGAHAPPFREVDATAVAEDLQRLAPSEDVDVLWVGLGVPKQVIWADLARSHAPARVIATVGAAFDFHAGVVPQAPPWMQDTGLEWLFRLSRDPRRLWRRYLVGNVQHVVGVGGDWWAARRGEAR